MGSRGASSGINKSAGGVLPPTMPLGEATWKQVVAANTDFLIKHSVYDFSGNPKYSEKNGYVSNGIGGAILKEYKEKLITKDQWEKARKRRKK